MRFNTYRRMTVAELRDILAQAIEVLDDYPDNTKIIERANTYGCPTPYLSTPKGFFPLKDLEFETDEVEEESIKPKSYVVEDGFETIFQRGTINKYAYQIMHKIYNIIHKYLNEDCGHDCYFLERTLVHKIRDIVFDSKNDGRWSWIFNQIDELVMKYFDDEDLGTECVRKIIEILQKD